MKGFRWLRNWFIRPTNIWEINQPQNTIEIRELQTWLLGHPRYSVIEGVIRSTLIPQLETLAGQKPAHCAHHVAVAEVHQVVKTFLGKSWAEEIAFDLETHINNNPKPF